MRTRLVVEGFSPCFAVTEIDWHRVAGVRWSRTLRTI